MIIVVMVKEVVTLKLTLTEAIILGVMIVLVTVSTVTTEGGFDGGRDVELLSRWGSWW